MSSWRGAAAASDGIPIHATLRPAPVESATGASIGDAAQPFSEPTTGARGQPLEGLAPARDSDRREAADVVTIPGAYVDARQLSEIPRPLQEPPLELLQSILARPGVARLMLYIDQAGRVTSVDVDSTTLPPEATERAVAIFSQTRFAPGRIGNLAVRSRIPVTVGAEERRAGG